MGKLYVLVSISLVLNIYLVARIHDMSLDIYATRKAFEFYIKERLKEEDGEKDELREDTE